MGISLVAITGAVLLLTFVWTSLARGQAQQAQFTNVHYAIHPQPFVFAIPLLEVGNIRAGPFKIHPHLGVAQTYTDNVFRNDPTFGGRKADWYTTLAPGIQLQLPILGSHRFVFDYRSNIERYAKHSSQDIEDQTLATNLMLDFPGGLTINAIGELKNGHDYRGTATASAATLSDEPNRFYTPNYGIEARFARQMFLRARYKYIRWQFIGPQAGPRDGTSFGDINTRTRVENYVALAAGRRLAPKTYLFLQGTASRHIYEINKELDSRTFGAAVGATWEVTGKTTGEVSVGWQAKNLDKASAGTRGNSNFSGLAVNGNIDWLPQERTQVKLGLYRRTSEAVLGGTRFLVSTGTHLNLRHAFTYKWSATAHIVYNADRYSDPIVAEGKFQTRRDDYLTLGGGLWYQIQPRLGVRAVYSYAERLSNFLSVQYVANVWMLSAQAQF